VRILFDGVTPGSSSGPNSFARKLQAALSDLGHACLHGAPGQGEDVRLAFIQCAPSDVPTALRLDGIYFNTRQDWKAMNDAIRRTYV
jgi:hypothetical protein